MPKSVLRAVSVNAIHSPVNWTIMEENNIPECKTHPFTLTYRSCYHLVVRDSDKLCLEQRISHNRYTSNAWRREFVLAAALHIYLFNYHSLVKFYLRFSIVEHLTHPSHCSCLLAVSSYTELLAVVWKSENTFLPVSSSFYRCLTCITALITSYFPPPFILSSRYEWIYSVKVNLATVRAIASRYKQQARLPLSRGFKYIISCARGDAAHRGARSLHHLQCVKTVQAHDDDNNRITVAILKWQRNANFEAAFTEKAGNNRS